MILHVINSLRTGGAERFVLEVVSEMKKHGCDVDVMVFERKDTMFSRELASRGIRVRHTFAASYWSPLNLITFLCVMLGRRYDVVHTHLTYAQFWVALVSLCNLTHKKLYTTEHSTWNNRRGRWIWRFIDRFIYSRYRRVFCISDATRLSLLRWIGHKNAGKCVVEPNGVVIEQFQRAKAADRSELGFNSGDVIVMMIGRMDRAKDQPTLIRAVESLPSRYKCVLVGDGDTMDSVRRMVTDSSRVVFLGMRSDIASLLKVCDVYVQSSHWEGMPTSILEAMAAGRPVFGSCVPGVKELLPAEQLFPQGDGLALADMIHSLTIQHYNAIVVKQRDIVQQYSISRIVDDLLNEYAQ